MVGLRDSKTKNKIMKLQKSAEIWEYVSIDSILYKFYYDLVVMQEYEDATVYRELILKICLN